MRSLRLGIAVAAALLFFSQTAASGSTVSDFQARLAQTIWNLQAVGGQLKSQPVSSRPAAAPEALSSFLDLLSENVAALVARSSARATDDQKKVMAGGLKAVAAHLRDFAAMSSHRGLATVAAELSSLEGDCRLVLAEAP